MVIVLEGDVGQLQAAGALDVDLARTVHHDLGDRLVTEERLQRAKTHDLVGDLLQHAHPLGTREGQTLLVDGDAEDLFDLAPHLYLVGEVQLGIQIGDDALLDAVLGIAERLTHRDLGDHTRWHRRTRRPGLARRCPWGRHGTWREGPTRDGRGRALAAGLGAFDPFQQ